MKRHLRSGTLITCPRMSVFMEGSRFVAARRCNLSHLRNEMTLYCGHESTGPCVEEAQGKVETLYLTLKSLCTLWIFFLSYLTKTKQELPSLDDLSIEIRPLLDHIQNLHSHTCTTYFKGLYLFYFYNTQGCPPQCLFKSPPLRTLAPHYSVKQVGM